MSRQQWSQLSEMELRSPKDGISLLGSALFRNSALPEARRSYWALVSAGMSISGDFHPWCSLDSLARQARPALIGGSRRSRVEFIPTWRTLRWRISLPASQYASGGSNLRNSGKRFAFFDFSTARRLPLILTRVCERQQRNDGTVYQRV